MTATLWNLEPPPGFQGLDPEKPIMVYRRHLPHWRQDGATYFVTFRLADALPQSKLRELKALKREWQHRLNHTNWQSLVRTTDWQSILRSPWAMCSRLVMERVEEWLDQGMGACWLRQPEFAQMVAEALHHFDGVQYELGCYVIMPNHVHLVLRPLTPAQYPLEKILQSRKRKTSHDIQLLLGKTGTFWLEESFDRIVRDVEHLYRCLQYIGANPRKAGLDAKACPRWIRPEWQRLGWTFEDSWAV